QRKLDHRLLDHWIGPVLQVRLLARDLRQRRLAAGLVQLLESIEAVPAEAEHLARLGDTAQRLRQFQQSELVLDDLLILSHLTSPLHPVRVGYVRSSRDYYMSARARAEQIDLCLLDPVLGLAARALQMVVQHGGRTLEVSQRRSAD